MTEQKQLASTRMHSAFLQLNAEFILAILLAINKTISGRINTSHDAHPVNIRPVQTPVAGRLSGIAAGCLSVSDSRQKPAPDFGGRSRDVMKGRRYLRDAGGVARDTQGRVG